MCKLRFRCVVGLVALMLCGICLVGCAESATKLERMQNDINIVKNVNSKIYLYKYKSDFLTENMQQVETINSLDELRVEQDFVMLAVTKEDYSDVDSDFIVKVLNLLSDFSNKLYVVFLDFPNLNFLKGTQFDVGKDHFPAYSFNSAFHNFANEIKKSGGTMNINKNGKVVPADYDENMMMGFARVIKEYNQSQ